MANNGSIVRKDLHDLSKPIEIRELNRQLDWIWKQLLGGLTLKSLSSDTTKKIMESSLSQAVIEQLIADRITANTIETKNLIANSIVANNAKIGTLVADEIRAGSIDANFLYATLAEMMVAKIGVAKIDYAQIVDMFSERIFTDAGIAGHFRMDGLEVTQAQIVDLIVSSFRLVSQDGKVYKVSVDANGEITTEYIEDEAEWMEDGKIPDGYSAVASSLTVGNVTSGNLYVSGAADIMKLTAKMLTVDKGFINELISTDIFASYLMANQAFIDLLRTSQIFGGQSLSIITERVSRNFRQESVPTGKINVGDTWVDPSIDIMYQAADASDLNLRLYLDSDGSLYYESSEDDEFFAMDGYDLLSDNIAFKVDEDDNIQTAIRWKVVTDISGIKAKQDELEGNQGKLETEQEKVGTHLVIGDTMVRICAPNSNSEVQINNVAMGVAINGEIFSRFEAERAVFGDMEVRRPDRGGIVIDSLSDNGGVNTFGYRV